MNDIKFNIEKQNLTRMDSEKVVDYSKGYLNAVFELKGSDWVDDTNYAKYALFRHGELSFAMELKRINLNEPVYTCIVPHEILRYNSFVLTVYAAGKKDTDVSANRITTNSQNIQVAASEFTTNLMSTRKPSADAFASIYEALDKKMNTDTAEEKIRTVVEEAINKIHIPNLTIISDSTKTSPEDLAGEKGDIWVNIYSTVSAESPVTITTTVLKFKHNGTSWETIA